MNIGEAARRSGLPAKTIRHYEDLGLVAPARAPNGYRDYAERDVHILRFLQRSVSLGFSVDETRRLLALYAPDARRDEARRVAQRRASEIDRKILELHTLRRALAVLMDETEAAAPRGWPVLDEVPNEGARMPRPAF
ncbi:MerR family transcriptional regulator [Aureimonas flava]|uniref:MerR family transcriptional regulator n=1 Tax=Aureimonas flava TaxID=2320271 RepID=A0A3A1WV48_9HYPH|nr:MerR family transcriptional regulator [Aureimonas flava]RIY02551.1 MerR family transcriptional regulator [Aureimonas flava]